MAANEVKRKVASSATSKDSASAASVVDELVDAVASVTQAALEQQDNVADATAGFDATVSSNEKVAETLESVAKILNDFVQNGGQVGQAGQTGGAASFGVVSKDAIREIVQEVVSRELDDTTDEIVDEVKSEGRKTREKVDEKADEQKKRDEALREQMAEINANTAKIDEMTNIVNQLSSGKPIGAIARGVTASLSKLVDSQAFKTVLAEVGTVVAGAGFAKSASVDLINKVNQAQYSMNQDALRQYGTTEVDTLTNSIGLGLDKQMYSFMTGMDEKQLESIQNMLAGKGATYGTDEYKTGLEFAMNASTEYGISGTTAAKMYTDMVMQGSTSMESLNTAMDALQETVKSTSLTMDDAVQDFQDSIRTLTGVAGNDTAAESMATDLQTYMAGNEMSDDNRGGANAYASFISTASNDITVQYAASEYEQQGYSRTEAYSLAAYDQLMKGMTTAGTAAQVLLQTPLSNNGDKKIQDYVSEQDWDGLKSALEDLNDSFGYYGSDKVGYVNQALKQLFPSLSNVSADDPDSVVETLRGYYSATSSMRNQTGGTAIGEQGDSVKGEWLGNQDTTYYDDTSQAAIYSDQVREAKLALGSENKSADSWEDLFSDTEDDAVMKSIVRLTSDSDLGYASDSALSQLGEGQLKEYAQQVEQLYASESDEVRSKGIYAWMQSDAGREAITGLADRYESAVDKAQDAESKGVTVEISLRDDAADYVYAAVKDKEAEESRNNGSGGEG